MESTPAMQKQEPVPAPQLQQVVVSTQRSTLPQSTGSASALPISLLAVLTPSKRVAGPADESASAKRTCTRCAEMDQLKQEVAALSQDIHTQATKLQATIQNANISSQNYMFWVEQNIQSNLAAMAKSVQQLQQPKQDQEPHLLGALTELSKFASGYLDHQTE